MDTFYLKIPNTTRAYAEYIKDILLINVDTVLFSQDEIIEVEELQARQDEQELTQFYKNRDL